MTRRAAARAILSAALTLWSGPLLAQADRLQEAWHGWLRAHDARPAALLAIRDGSEILLSGDGVEADAPVPLASLSKAVTGLCALALVEEGALRWDQPLQELFGQGGAITSADLVTHRSGLMPDQTQGIMADWRNGPPRWQQAAKTALARDSQSGTRGTYAYNNENYALLGAVIEAATGQDYTTACKQRVTGPLGLNSAGLDPVYGAFGPWGGWRMSLRDYARLMQAYAGTDPLATPSADLGGGAVYGLGMLARPARDDAKRWHFGLLCFDDGAFGTYAVRWAEGTTIVATWTGCTDFAAMAKLDQAMSRAVFSD